jgi:histidinol-phosphate aminotransferase
MIRLHANEHPESVITGLDAALASAQAELHRYPAGAESLARALAERHEVRREQVLVGPGSADLIASLWRQATSPARPAAFAVPAFELYPLLCRQLGVPSLTWPAADAPPAASGLARAGLVALSNPYNPTGAHVPRRTVARLAAELPADTIVLNDEAYAEYAAWEPDDLSLAGLCELPNLLTTRTFSKLYGLAGLRVGYALGAPGLIGRLAAMQLPFAVGQLGAVAALHALERGDDVAAARRRVTVARERLTGDLRERGFEVAESQANFVFAAPPGGDPDGCAAALADRGVLVRSTPPGLRISVGSRAELGRLLDAVDEVLA